MKYKVVMEVSLKTSNIIEVDANCKEEAIKKVQTNYYNGIYNEEIAEAMYNEEWSVTIN